MTLAPNHSRRRQQHRPEADCPGIDHGFLQRHALRTPQLNKKPTRIMERR